MITTLQDAQDYLKFLEVDILYIDFYTPPRSSAGSELTNDDIVIRYDDQNEDEIVGLSILNVSKR
jgi:Protein of unknown function (DUF2283)